MIFMKINAGNLKKGDFVKYQNKIWQIQKVEFYYSGRGSALMKTKLKSLKDGKQMNQTFKSNDQIEVVEVDIKKMQFLYGQRNKLYFMDLKSFDQYELAETIVGKLKSFLKEGKEYYLSLYKDDILNIKFPKSVKFKVIKSEEAIKGDRVSGAKKTVVVENGVSVVVPIFIKQGDEIIINPEKGEYIERAKAK